MSKTIHTLAKDIYNILDSTQDHEPDAGIATHYAMRIGGEFAKATLKRDKPRQLGQLWASDLGKTCLRQTWYNFNAPQLGELLEGHTKFKFLYGNILEEAVLYMAEEAGHKVEYKQEPVKIELVSGWSVSGRIDAVIDGVLVDVKSTSSYGFQRYKDGIDATNDSFGYIQQLSFYDAYGDFGASKEEAGFVWIDKQNGHIQYSSCLTEGAQQLEQRASELVSSISQPSEQSVPRGYQDKPYGKSGNLCLPVGCSYCAFKFDCWKDSNNGRGLRTFAYSQGPVFFTEVVNEPRVPEIK